jgi:hypothetical protein
MSWTPIGSPAAERVIGATVAGRPGAVAGAPNEFGEQADVVRIDAVDRHGRLPIQLRRIAGPDRGEQQAHVGARHLDLVGQQRAVPPNRRAGRGQRRPELVDGAAHLGRGR